MKAAKKLPLFFAVFSLICVLSASDLLGVSAAATMEKQILLSEQDVPFATQYIDLPDHYRGYTELVSRGAPGKRSTTTHIVHSGGESRVVYEQSAMTAAPVEQVMYRGSKTLVSKTADGGHSRVSFIYPLDTGWLSGDFYDYPDHGGIDLAAPLGTPVYAAAQGTVAMSGWFGEYGYCVVIDHADSSQTLYAHNSKLLVKAGQEVLQGEEIAKVGTTGNSAGYHLHFELRHGGQCLDPLLYLGK